MTITETMNQMDDNSNSKQIVQSLKSNDTTRMDPDPGPIDFDECLKDSPRFRQDLKENLASVELLESSMAKTIKHVSNLIETGREHIKSQKEFINSLRSLNNALGPTQATTTKRVGDLLEILEEVGRLQDIVLDQSARTVGNSLTNFINSDLSRLREARKSFDKISNEYDQALIRYSQPLKKQQEDSENLLIATSTAFAHTSLDLSIQLTELQSKKGIEILASLLSFVRAHGTFFHQGYDLIEDFKPHMSEMDEHIAKIQDDYEILTRNLPSKHLMVSNNELRPLIFDNQAQQIHLEGYLFKRASNGFKVWNRRWFILKDHRLVYMKRGDTQPIVMEEDLRLLTVRRVDRADSERRFCFEIVSPHKSHILQAETESACKTWIQAIQAGINAAFHDTDSEGPTRDNVDSSVFSHQTGPNSHQQQGPNSNKQNGSSSVSSSWSSSFSLKSLQQQATSKLNSITGGDSRDPGATKMKDRRVHPKILTKRVMNDDELEELGEQDNESEANDLPQPYSLLRHDDNEEDANDNDNDLVQNDSLQHVAKYPAPASIARSNQSSETTTPGAKTTSSSPAEPPEKPQRAYMIILGIQGNDECADCGAQQPRWASINLGITLCIECAGIHRSLGVHLSKVRSLTLDTEVWSPEIVQLMLSLGNISVNSAYLACYRGQIAKINSESSREERENWIRAKYLLKTFMRPPDVVLDDLEIASGDDACDEIVAAEQPNTHACPPQFEHKQTQAIKCDNEHRDEKESISPHQ